MSRASLMAGFEVTLHGRIWVTPEEAEICELQEGPLTLPLELQPRDLPGKPDLVFPSRHKVIFVTCNEISPGTGENLMKTTAAKTSSHLEQGFRLLSAYLLRDGGKIWIITESDKSSTIM